MGPWDMRMDSSMTVHREAAMPPATFSVPSNSQHAQPQPQPQHYAMLPPASQQNDIRKYKPEDWNVQRPEITRLYENDTLGSVMEFMRERYGLDATAKQYKDRFKLWGLNKNIRADEMEPIIKIQQKRGLENKQTAFRVGKRPVNSEKIKRYMKTHPIPAFGANKNGNMNENIDSAATPLAVSYYTPPETGPLTPHEAPGPEVTANPQSPSPYQNAQGGSYHFGILDPSSPLERLEVENQAEEGDSAGSEQTRGKSKSEQLSLPAKPGEQPTVHDNIASADLENPSDALKILAQVADRLEDDDYHGSKQTRSNNNQPQQFRPSPWRQGPSPSKADDYIQHKPLQAGLISLEMIHHLFLSYKESFHPFFPIISRQTFDPERLPWLSRAQPYLFSAILTVASRDNERVHQICYDHMKLLLSMIFAGSDANIETIEALLVLSQWVSHDPPASVGHGEEDKLAWMYIGNALRLGYLLEIDRTSFKSDSHEDPATFNRKKLVWSACYMCDSQVSVRLGKGFWARGPGPLSGSRASDYPTLQPLSPNEDDWALIFQANLELTKIFSNVHDILYSSKGYNWKEMLEGRYEKYLDDFLICTRTWNDTWGTLICSPRLKASLLLTYDYLRLYINSFAYQATISRAMSFQRDSQHNPYGPIPLINATSPDARFIYEAIDAAKSLLSTFNNFVNPETLNHMPSCYYLFIIYSAVFLYKVKSTTTMTEEERTGIRRMINQTIEHLQKSSVGANHMGSRYARLLQLLWRKAPQRSDLRETQHRQSIDYRVSDPQDHGQSGPQSNFDATNLSDMGGMNNVGLTPSGTFSWLDLGATWNFATQNGSSGDLEDVMVDIDMSSFDMNLQWDFSLLESDNPNLIF